MEVWDDPWIPISFGTPSRDADCEVVVEVKDNTNIRRAWYLDGKWISTDGRELKHVTKWRIIE